MPRKYKRCYITIVRFLEKRQARANTFRFYLSIINTQRTLYLESTLQTYLSQRFLCEWENGGRKIYLEMKNSHLIVETLMEAAVRLLNSRVDIGSQKTLMRFATPRGRSKKRERTYFRGDLLFFKEVVSQLASLSPAAESYFPLRLRTSRKACRHWDSLVDRPIDRSQETRIRYLCPRAWNRRPSMLNTSAKRSTITCRDIEFHAANAVTGWGLVYRVFVFHDYSLFPVSCLISIARGRVGHGTRPAARFTASKQFDPTRRWIMNYIRHRWYLEGISAMHRHGHETEWSNLRYVR